MWTKIFQYKLFTGFPLYLLTFFTDQTEIPLVLLKTKSALGGEGSVYIFPHLVSLTMQSGKLLPLLEQDGSKKWQIARQFEWQL